MSEVSELSEPALQAGKQDWQEQKAVVNEPVCSLGRQQMVGKPEGILEKKGKQARVPSSRNRRHPDAPIRNQREAHCSGGGYSTSNSLSDTFLRGTGKNNLALDSWSLPPALTLLLS